MAILYVEDEFEHDVTAFLIDKKKKKEHLEKCGKYYSRAERHWNANLKKIDKSLEKLTGKEKIATSLGWKALKHEIIDWASLGQVMGEKAVDWVCGRNGLNGEQRDFFIESLKKMKLFDEDCKSISIFRQQKERQRELQAIKDSEDDGGNVI